MPSVDISSVSSAVYYFDPLGIPKLDVNHPDFAKSILAYRILQSLKKYDDLVEPRQEFIGYVARNLLPKNRSKGFEIVKRILEKGYDGIKV